MVINEKINRLKQTFFKKDILQHDDNLDNDNKELLNYYSSLVVYHPDIIIIFSKDAEIVSLDNKKIYSLFGKSINNTEELKEYISEQNYQVLSSAFAQTLKRKSEKRKIEVVDKNDKSLSLGLTFIPIVDKDEVEGVYLIITDITEKVVQGKARTF